MDSSQPSSFIPKSPVSGNVQKRRARKVYIFTFLIYIFFTASLLASGGTWFYKYTVQKNLNAMKLAVNQERENFSQTNMEQVTAFNERLIAAKDLLDAQVSLVSVLKAIEAVTVASVDISGFTYEKTENNTLALKLSARANGFNTLLFQRSIFPGNTVLAGSAITGVTYNSGDSTTGGEVITFSLEKDLNEGLIKTVADSVPTSIVTPEAETMPTASSTSDVLDATELPASSEAMTQ